MNRGSSSVGILPYALNIARPLEDFGFAAMMWLLMFVHHRGGDAVNGVTSGLATSSRWPSPPVMLQTAMGVGRPEDNGTKPDAYLSP